MADPSPAVAFTAVYLTWRGAVFGRILRVVRDPHVAEDLMGETFLHAWQAWPRFGTDGRAYVRAWLYGIARNVTLVWLRKQRRARYWAARTGPLREETAPSPLTLLCAQETATRARRALARIPPRHRAVLALRVAGYTYPEMETALGLTRGALKQLLHRSRQRAQVAYQLAD